jgi:hypothetical protein
MLAELEKELARRRQERIDRGEILRVTEFIVAGHPISLARILARITAELRERGEAREIIFENTIVTGVCRSGRDDGVEFEPAPITWDEDDYPGATRH